MYVILAICLIVLAIFGVASFMDSYATAKQAQATIEVAQVAQVNAWGNLVVILLLALVILLVAALIVWMVIRRAASQDPRPPRFDERAYRRVTSLPAPPAPPPSLETLLRLEELRLLRSLTRQTDPTRNEQVEDPDDLLPWLRS